MKATTFIKRHGKLLEIYEEHGNVWLPRKAYFGLSLLVRGELFGEEHSYKLDEVQEPDHVKHVDRRLKREGRKRGNASGVYVYRSSVHGDRTWKDDKTT